MREIEKPFRITWDFCIVWAFLVIPTFILTGPHELGPWYAKTGLIVVGSLFATFILYGPALLVGQVVRSGPKGRMIARVGVSIILTAALVFGGLLFSGFYTESRARILAFVFLAGASMYLSSKLQKQSKNG